MAKISEDSLGIPNVVWFSGAIGGGLILVALAIKSVFSQDISLEVLSARLEISNSKLELAEKATRIKEVASNTGEIVQQLEKANQAHKLASENLKACRYELEEYLPPMDKEPRPMPAVIDPVADEELKQVEQNIEEAKETLDEELDKIFDDG